MKIIKIKITFENILPQDPESEINDPEIETIELMRNEIKIWHVESSHTSRRGLFPYEIRLANMIQDLIAKFNANSKE
jgi:hypothetical protein